MSIIRNCVAHAIEADSKMNKWTSEQLACFRQRFYDIALGKVTDLFLDKRALSAHTGLPIGHTAGAHQLSLQRIRNQGAGAAHFRVVVDVTTGECTLDISNCELIERFGQGTTGWDMNRKLYLHALLHTKLPIRATPQQLAAIRAEYDQLDAPVSYAQHIARIARK